MPFFLFVRNLNKEVKLLTDLNQGDWKVLQGDAKMNIICIANNARFFVIIILIISFDSFHDLYKLTTTPHHVVTSPLKILIFITALIPAIHS